MFLKPLLVTAIGLATPAAITDIPLSDQASAPSTVTQQAEPAIVCPETPSPCVWDRTYGGNRADRIQTIVPDGDGGFFVAGHTKSTGKGDFDTWVMRVDRAGEPVWKRTFGTKGVDRMFSADTTSDGGLIVAGHTTTLLGKGIDFWVLRLAADGRLFWQRTYGGRGIERAHAVKALPDGGAVVAGFTNSKGAGDRDGWLIRLDAAGKLLWDRTFGDRRDDGFNAMALQRDEDTGDVAGITLAGYHQSDRTGRYRGMVVQVGLDGEQQWQTMVDQGPFTVLTGIAASPDGGVAAAGVTQDDNSIRDNVIVVGLDPHGDARWQKDLRGDRDDSVWSIQPQPGGGYALAGSTSSRGAGSSDAWVIGLTGNGALDWFRLYGGSQWDQTLALAISPDGGMALAGYTTSRGAGQEDGWILRLDSRGNLGHGETAIGQAAQ
ncbi:MAG: hypothetical protein RIM72_19970 [Alphaproteobacteria bacterium]